MIKNNLYQIVNYEDGDSGIGSWELETTTPDSLLPTPNCVRHGFINGIGIRY